MSDGRPTAAQLRYLERGLAQPGGKLPLFDDEGQRVDAQTVRACLRQGWAEPWFANPLKPDWLVCKLTPAGRLQAGAPPDGAMAADGRNDVNVVAFRRPAVTAR